MNPEQPGTHETDDTEGHAIKARGADTERDETDDTEGHMPRIRFGDAERDETDDTEGHARVAVKADTERDETDDPDDTEGHRIYAGSDARLKRSITPLTGALEALRRPADRG